MCGIAGWQFTPGFNPDLSYKAILLLHLASAMDRRGGDSYGLAKVNSRGKISLWKRLGHAIGDVRLLDASNTQQLILHTRRRTHGEVSIDNAHPLRYGHILGTHNGVVSNHDSLNKKYKRDFDLDSRHIFAHLSEGLKVSEIGVYGAISWIDLNQPNVVNLCRLSSHGDLEVYGIGPDKERLRGVVYASTKDPIINALQALREPFFPYDPVEAKRRYFIQGGRLLVDTSSKGRLPFGEDIYYHTTYNRGGFSLLRNSRTWECPQWMMLCKKCRKKYYKNLNFRTADLCSKCTTKYWDNLPAITRRDTKCCECGLYGALEENGKTWCTVCLREAKKKARGAREARSGEEPAPHALKPGGPSCNHATCRGEACCVFERVEEQELLEAISGRGGDYVLREPSVVPPYLEQWDLCEWCAEEARKKKGWHFEDWCPGCKGNWTAMMADLKEMEKGERRLFAQVAICSTCKVVPTFGNLRKDAFLDDGQSIAKCKKCRETREVARGNEEIECALCGSKQPTTEMCYSPTVRESDGVITYYPRCKKCYDDKGEIVPLKGEEDGAKAAKG